MEPRIPSSKKHTHIALTRQNKPVQYSETSNSHESNLGVVLNSIMHNIHKSDIFYTSCFMKILKTVHQILRFKKNQGTVSWWRISYVILVIIL